MAGRPKKLPKNARDLSPRQWAWEFLRFNEAYRVGYAWWMGLHWSVRKVDLETCPPETPMSLFLVQPAAKDGETVGAWLTRTEESRRNGWSVGHAPSSTPKPRFGISKWIDPEITPLSKDDEIIFDDLQLDVYAELSEHEHHRHKPLTLTVGNIKKNEVVIKINFLHPIGFLTESIKKLVFQQRELLLDIGDFPLTSYKGGGSLNQAGVYEAYIKILQRIANGESKKDITRITPDGQHVASDDPYATRTKKQYSMALALRDEGYRQIAYYEDFIGVIRGE